MGGLSVDWMLNSLEERLLWDFGDRYASLFVTDEEAANSAPRGFSLLRLRAFDEVQALKYTETGASLHL